MNTFQEIKTTENTETIIATNGGFAETKCTFALDGKTFTAGGACLLERPDGRFGGIMKNNTRKIAKFKWAVSKARDTYGYNVCTLYVDNKKVARCNGGGYDMEGTCFGRYLQQEFSDRLVKLTTQYTGLRFNDPDFDPGQVVIDGMTIDEREQTGISLGLERYQADHSASLPIPTERHHVPLLDGGCGMDEMFKIANAIGIDVLYIEKSMYLLDISETPRGESL